MELVRGLHNLNAEHRGCVATIGNFDGVHKGHQLIIEHLNATAKTLSLPGVVVVFEPQPQEYFAGDKTPARLTRLREKLIALADYGVERVVCLPFNAKLAGLSPLAFIQHILVDKLAIKHVIVGDDFRFGAKREGDFTLLQQAGSEFNFTVSSFHTVEFEALRVSSTRVREALQQGDLARAELLLGRTYSMCGRVAHGDKRGRQLGVPTANVYLHREVSPISGVYVVDVYGLDDEPIHGVANVGTRPTVDGTQSLLEVHMFNFNREIYGRYIEVRFLKKLRNEQRFDSFDLLKQQIFKDIEQAKQYFGQ